MISKALIVLALAFVLLGAVRWVIARPRPRWVMPAALGISVALVLGKLGVAGLLAGGLAFVSLLVMETTRKAVAEGADADEAVARALLDVSAAASRSEIRAAHRRLIATAHPDLGGAEDLTTRLNVARDLLLRKAKI